MQGIYAIVDIETTGGHASANSITEICIITHNGHHQLERFETLINPQQNIPPFIQAYTNITNEMVAHAPTFQQVAAKIYDLLHNKIFVAHSVNFDYSFIQHQLRSCGFVLNTPKLCTVRLSRKIFPGFPSYSLGNICAQFDIHIHARHRAGGDTEATVLLFEKLIANDSTGIIQGMQKKFNGEVFLPSNVDKQNFDTLPHAPGVYYFRNRQGKIIYIGKAKNLRKRVSTHFANNSPRKRRQEFLQNIFDIDFVTCTTELMAIILESIEIKKHWPEYNRSQKFNEKLFGIYDYTDQQGIVRLAIDTYKKNVVPLMMSANPGDLQLALWTLVKEHDLCPQYCSLLDNVQAAQHSCPACTLTTKRYNKRVTKAAEYLITNKRTFVITEKNYASQQTCCYLVEQGKFYGMATIDDASYAHDLSSIKNLVQRYKSNTFIDNLLHRLSATMQCIEFLNPHTTEASSSSQYISA